MELLFTPPQQQQHHHRHQQQQPNNTLTTEQNEIPTPLTSLISALEHATQTTKHFSSSSSSESLAALASLRNVHQMIGSFLSQLESQPSIPDGDETMYDRREGEEELEVEGGGGGEGSRIIEEVEEGMRECVLQSKRRKRQVSPLWVAGRAADQGEEFSSVDPMDRRRSSMDLVFQFHA